MQVAANGTSSALNGRASAGPTYGASSSSAFGQGPAATLLSMLHPLEDLQVSGSRMKPAKLALRLFGDALGLQIRTIKSCTCG